MSEDNLGTYYAHRAVYDNSAYAERVRAAVEEVNKIVHDAPKDVNVRFSVLDMSTFARRKETLTVNVSQKL